MYSIPRSQIVKEIRSGMSDDEIMKKHELPLKLFQRLLQILVNEKALDHSELYEKSATYRALADRLASRGSPRVYLPIAIPVYHDETSQKGFVRDISETGVRVAGIGAQNGDELTLRMSIKRDTEDVSLQFKVICRWSRIEGKSRKYPVTGFEITELGEEARIQFTELMDQFQSQNPRWERSLREPTSSSEERRPVDSMDTEPASHQFSGTVHGVDILDFVQFMLLSGKKTMLEIKTESGDSCHVHLDEGRIVHASFGEQDGREAFYECMNVPGGSFFTRPWQEPGETTIDDPGEFLIMEAARRRDESSQRARSIQEQRILEEDIPQEQDTTDRPDDQLPQRWYPHTPFPVYDVDAVMGEGHIVELGENRFNVTGIDAAVGQRKNFVIHVENFPDIFPFSFEAECRWVKSDPDTGLVAGFEITDIPEKGVEEMEVILKTLTFSG